MPPIDVIIPVYRGFAETRRCIDSVLNSDCDTAMRVVVVDDASPEPELSRWLASLAVRSRIELLVHSDNRGFVRSVNEAMTQHLEHDAVLLNSDTEVSPGWLDRLVACADRHGDAASVCPFSNNATLLSYPQIGANNSLPPGAHTAAMAAFFAEANPDWDCPIPTAVGFCMFIRRRAWQEIGPFDDGAFGRGYGEENDWCIRAERAGYRHYVAGDAFVFHAGEVSFGADAARNKEYAQSVIDARDPDYSIRIAAFFTADPLRIARRRVDLARLRHSALPKLLFVTHQWGGGTEQHVNELAGLIDGHAITLVMKPRGPNMVEIRWVSGEANREEFNVHFSWASDREPLLEFLRDLGIARVHLHHVHGHAPSVLELARLLGVPLDVTIHDFFPLTAQYHLDHGGVIPTNAHSTWGWTADEWRDRMRGFLASAARLIAPSRDVAARINAVFPDVRVDVWPHPELPRCGAARPAKVLILGGITKDKGLDVVMACARDAKARGLPLHFEFLGHVEEPIDVFPELPVTLLGGYPQGDVDLLISLSRPDVAFFPAQIPESFSFTLSAVLRAELPIVASRLGAFTERLETVHAATLMPWNASPPEWNDALLRLVVTTGRLADVDAAASEKYRLRYLEPVRALATVRLVNLPEYRFFASRKLPKEGADSLKHLFRGGVLSGNLSARKELERRIGQFDDEVRWAREAAEEARTAARLAAEREVENAQRFRAAYENQEASAKAWQREYESVLKSRSWRITAPMRTVVTAAKGMRASISRMRQRVTLLPMQAAMAYRILRQQGPHALAMRLKQRWIPERPQLPLEPRQFNVESHFLPIELPDSNVSPRWSILVPVHGQHALTYTCLKSVAETCAALDIEVIVADDASAEPAASALSMVTGVRWLRNPENLGFLRTCNKAAQEARGEFLVLLNNDTIVTGDWLKELTAVFEQDPKAGLAGAKLLFRDGSLQEAGGIVWRDGSASNYGRGSDPRRPEFNYRRDVDYCSGACIMVPLELWKDLGGFDERYLPAYYEDTDLAFRIREGGRKVIYQPHAEVVHFEGQTSGTDLSQGVKRHQVANQSVFEKRWRSTLARHRPNGMAPHLERDRAATRRVLVYDHCVPRPDRDSGSLRMFEMLKAMRALGCRVSFVPDFDISAAEYGRALQSLGVELLRQPYLESLDDPIARYGADFDVVLLSRPMVASKYVDLARYRMAHAKLIFDTVDLHFLRMRREAALSGGAMEAAAADRMEALEMSLVEKADVTLVVSPFERDLLSTKVPRSHVQVLSNIHEPDPTPLGFAARQGVVFIGGFLHPPNVDAMQWYATEVLPILRARAPGLKTTVIGGDAPACITDLAAPDFEFTGFVPDVKPHFNSARVAISPLRYGAGVKGKVNLAMQYGVPVVATPCSVEGMHLDHGKNVYVADDAEAFAAGLLDVCNNESTWNTLREGGLANIRDCFSRVRATAVLKEILDL